MAFAAQWLLALLSQQAEPSAPVRIRLFDRMDEARVEGRLEPSPSSPREHAKTALGFEPGFAAAHRAWLAKPNGRNATWLPATWEQATLTKDGGLHGGALQLGPGLAEDRSFLAFVVPAEPLAHYVLRGRIKVEGHPSA